MGTVIKFQTRKKPEPVEAPRTAKQIMADWDRLIAQIAVEMKEPAR